MTGAARLYRATSSDRRERGRPSGWASGSLPPPQVVEHPASGGAMVRNAFMNGKLNDLISKG